VVMIRPRPDSPQVVLMDQNKGYFWSLPPERPSVLAPANIAVDAGNARCAVDKGRVLVAIPLEISWSPDRRRSATQPRTFPNWLPIHPARELNSKRGRTWRVARSISDP
jgi:hypothetical protein